MISVNFRPAGRRQPPSADNPDYLLVNWRIQSRPHLWRPPTDILETEDAFLVRVEVAGMQEDGFEINFDQNILVISGTRPDTGEPRIFHRMEINFGDFLTAVEIPGNVSPKDASAQYTGGMLLVTLPKAHPRHISLHSE